MHAWKGVWQKELVVRALWRETSAVGRARYRVATLEPPDKSHFSAPETTFAGKKSGSGAEETRGHLPIASKLC